MSSIRKTLFWQLSRALLILLLILGGAVVWVFILVFNQVNYRLEQMLGWSTASAIAAELLPLVKEKAPYWSLQQTVDKFLAINPKLSVYIVGTDGRVITDFGGTQEFDLKFVAVDPIKRFLSATVEKAEPILGDNPRDQDRPMVFSAAPLNTESLSAYVYVILLNDKQKRLATVFQLRNAFAGLSTGFVLTLGAAAIIGLITFYLLTARFRRIIEIVSEYRQGNFTRRLPQGERDEFDPLVGAINKMADAIVSNIAELKKKDELRRELITTVSGDLQKPVELISSHSTDILSSDLTLGDESRRYCDTIRRNCTSLSQLLTELSELAKFETEEIRITLSKISISELFQNVVTDFALKAKQAELDLVIDIKGELPAVCGDTLLVHRVIANLVENALRYTPKGGKITLQAYSQGERVVIKISDTGIGISAEDLPNIFERFYQVQNAGAYANGLSGLGLAIVRKIAEAHGSKIAVESVENQGTTFSFDLPHDPSRLILQPEVGS